MSDIPSIFTVFLLMLAASAFPGPGDLLVVAAALESGPRGSMRVVLGILLGDTVFIVLATAGIHTAAQLYPGADQLLGTMSILLLLTLGGWMFHSASGSTRPALPATRPGATQGFFLTLADPTAIGFYAALLPPLANSRAIRVGDGFRLLACAAIAIVLVKSAYTFLALHLRERLLSPLLLNRLKRLTAGGILSIAGWMILTRLYRPS